MVRRALVLGGTSGIGLGAACALVAAGVATTITGRDVEHTREMARTISAQVCALAWDAVESHEGVVGCEPVDILVVNGPGYAPGLLSQVSVQDFRQGFESMFMAQLAVIDQHLAYMRANRWGRIVYVSSSSVVSPIDALAVSSVIRSAMHSYLKLLAHDVASDNITVNSVLPGRIDTPRVQHIDQTLAHASGLTCETVRAESEQAIPVKRYGTIEEIGAVIAFLASDAASYVTGSAIRCDGGAITSL